MKRQIESKLTKLENQRKEFSSTGKGSDYEFYQRLAGEAEARAVQKRLELTEDLKEFPDGYGDISTDMIKSDYNKVPTELYDVPLNELAFTGQSRSVAAKNQAKANAQSILDQPSQMDQSAFINKFTDSPNAAFWNKSELDKIKTEAGYGPEYIQDTFKAVRQANLKATIREMKKDGWDVQHTSTDSGKVSSYYLNKGGG